MARRPQPAPIAGRHPISTGVAALVADRDRRNAWTLFVNGMESSHVDLDDPTRLEFEYMRWIAAGIAAFTGVRGDGLPQRGGSAPRDLQVVHLGGGGCTLAQYLSLEHPAIRQVVIELDPGVLELAKTAFGLRSQSRLRLRSGEARAAVASLDDGGADVIIRDAFIGSTVPAHLTTTEFVDDARRVLGKAGLYLANLADGTDLATARREAATALSVFDHVALVAEPAQLRGRRYGNVVLAGSHSELPIRDWQRGLASDPVRTRLLDTSEVRDFASGRRPLRDSEFVWDAGMGPDLTNHSNAATD